jgi:hypothetical protein
MQLPPELLYMCVQQLPPSSQLKLRSCSQVTEDMVQALGTVKQASDSLQKLLIRMTLLLLIMSRLCD